VSLTPDDLARIGAAWSARPEHTRAVVLRGVLGSPVAWHRVPPRIEGFLALAAIMATLGRVPEAPGAAPAWVPCPVARVAFGGHDVDAASWPRPVGAWAWAHRHLRKRPDAESYAAPSGKVLIAGGEYKAIDRIEQTLCAGALEWHLRADVPRLLALLPHMDAVGRTSGGGLGEVTRWEVYDDPDDAALIVGGVAQRPLPVDPEMPLVAGSEIRMEPLRAPYWHPGTPRAPCMMPEPLC